MSEEETLVPLDESDILAHCERQEQKIKKLEAALLEKEGENDALSERFNDQAESFQQTRAELAGREEQIAALKDDLRLFNPCGHSNVESAVCGICGYPDPRKAIASLKEDFEAMARTAGLQAEEIAALNSDVRGWMVKGLVLGEEREKLKEQVAALTEKLEFYRKNRTVQRLDALTAERDRQNDFINKVEIAYPEFYEHHRQALRGGKDE